jgi:hypothetical protein
VALPSPSVALPSPSVALPSPSVALPSPIQTTFEIKASVSESIFIKNNQEIHIPCKEPDLLTTFFLANLETFTQDTIYDIAEYILSKRR